MISISAGLLLTYKSGTAGGPAAPRYAAPPRPAAAGGVDFGRLGPTAG